ncbi:hypothetical protein CRG98_045921, partial [Punica granatum]
ELENEVDTAEIERLLDSITSDNPLDQKKNRNKMLVEIKLKDPLKEVKVPNNIPYTIKDVEEFKEECKTLLELGVIRPSKSRHSAPAFYVENHNELKRGKRRMVINYKKMNEATFGDAYSLPRKDYILAKLKGCQWFSTLDAKSGYWQIRLEESTKELTAFTCPPQKQYEFNVLPFGLKQAPSIYQRFMDENLSAVVGKASEIDVKEFLSLLRVKSFDEVDASNEILFASAYTPYSCARKSPGLFPASNAKWLSHGPRVKHDDSILTKAFKRIQTRLQSRKINPLATGIGAIYIRGTAHQRKQELSSRHPNPGMEAIKALDDIVATKMATIEALMKEVENIQLQKNTLKKILGLEEESLPAETQKDSLPAGIKELVPEYIRQSAEQRNKESGEQLPDPKQSTGPKKKWSDYSEDEAEVVESKLSTTRTEETVTGSKLPVTSTAVAEVVEYKESYKTQGFYPIWRNAYGPKVIILPEATAETVYEFFMSGLVDTIYCDGKSLVSQFKLFPNRLQDAIRQFCIRVLEGNPMFIKCYSIYPGFFPRGEDIQEKPIDARHLMVLGKSNQNYPPIDSCPAEALRQDQRDGFYIVNYVGLCRRLQNMQQQTAVRYKSATTLLVSHPPNPKFTMNPAQERVLRAFERPVIDLEICKPRNQQELCANLSGLKGEWVGNHKCQLCSPKPKAEESSPTKDASGGSSPQGVSDSELEPLED